jgi:hypothetical protein
MCSSFYDLWRKKDAWSLLRTKDKDLNKLKAEGQRNRADKGRDPKKALVRDEKLMASPGAAEIC